MNTRRQVEVFHLAGRSFPSSTAARAARPATPHPKVFCKNGLTKGFRIIEAFSRALAPVLLPPTRLGKPVEGVALTDTLFIVENP